MTEDEMLELDVGDIVRHAEGGESYVVTGNYVGRVTAVRTVDITNASEWELFLKASEWKLFLKVYPDPLDYDERAESPEHETPLRAASHGRFYEC